MAKDHNSQRARNFKTTFKQPNLDKARIPNGKNAELLEAVRDLIAASAKDLYGDNTDYKYIYITDLILQRIKNVLDDLNVKDTKEEIKDKLDTIDNDIDIKLDEVKSLIEKDHEHRKEDFLKQKEEIENIIDSKVEEKNKEETPNIKNSASNADSMQEFAVNSAQNVIDTIINSVELQFASLSEAVSNGFSALQDRQLKMSAAFDTFQSINVKQFNAIDGKIVSSERKLLTAIQQINTANANIAYSGQSSSILLQAIGAISSNVCNLQEIVVQTATRLIFISAITAAYVRKTYDVSNDTYRLLKRTGAALSRDTRQSQNRIGEWFGNLRFGITEFTSKAFGKMRRLLNSISTHMHEGFNQLRKLTRRAISAAKSAAGATGSFIMKGLSFIMGPIGFAVNAVFRMFSIVFKPLRWLLGLFKSPLVIAAILIPLFIKYRKQILDFYNKKIKPIVIKVLGILGDDDLPLPQRIFKAIKVGAKELWKVIFPNGFIKTMESFWTETVWPFTKKHIIPFIQEHWKEILVGLGLAYLISNPFKALSLGLGFIRTTLLAIKVAVMVAKGAASIAKGSVGLITKLGASLLGCGPVGWVAIAGAVVVGGLLWGKFNEMQEAQANLRTMATEEWLKANKRGLETTQHLDSISQRMDETFEQFGDILDAYNIKNMKQAVPKVFDYVDSKGNKIIADKVTIQKRMTALLKNEGLVGHAGTLAVRNQRNYKKFMEHLEAGKFGDFEEDDMEKWNFSGHYMSRIYNVIKKVRGFVQEYVKREQNFIGDPQVGIRLKAFVEEMNKIEASASARLSLFWKGLNETWTSEDNDEWRPKYQAILDDVKNSSTNALQKFLDRGGDKAGLGLKASTQAKNLVLYADNKMLDALTTENKDAVKEELEGEKTLETMYGLSDLSRIQERATLKAGKILEDTLSKLDIATDATEEADKLRQQLKDLIEAATISKMNTTGGETISDKDIAGITSNASLLLYSQLREQTANIKSRKNLSIGMQRLLEQLEKQQNIIAYNSVLQNLGSIKTDKEGQAAIRKGVAQFFSSAKFADGKVDITSADAQTKLLEDVQKQLQASAKDEKEQKQVLAMLQQLLAGQKELGEDVKKQKPSTTNVTAVGGMAPQNGADRAKNPVQYGQKR